MDVGALGHFVMANGVEPNWLQMQLPFGMTVVSFIQCDALTATGRNMSQCIQVTDKFGIKRASWLKRKTSDDQGGPDAKRMASQAASQMQTQGNQEQAPVTVAATHKAILPRPPSNSEESTPAPAPAPPPPAPTGPKKKGRPARADRAKLHPILPPTIAPRPPAEPSTEANNEPDNQVEKQPQAKNQASEAPVTQPKKQTRGRGKAKQPAAKQPARASTPASQNQEPTDPPPMSNYITTFPSVPPGGFQNDKTGPVQDESAQPVSRTCYLTRTPLMEPSVSW